MTLLVCIFAAIISTVIWYVKSPKSREYLIGVPVLMFWGATIMWLADAIMEYAKIGSKIFTPAIEDMINDTFLGLAVVALGLIVWLVVLLIKDPKGVIRGMIKK